MSHECFFLSPPLNGYKTKVEQLEEIRREAEEKTLRSLQRYEPQKENEKRNSITIVGLDSKYINSIKSIIICSKTFEEEELEKKLTELSVLQAELTERELELVTLQGELHTFEREYLQIIGTRYAELDEIEAEIAKYLALLNPNDCKAQKQAEEAWTRAKDSKRATEENLKNQESSRDFKPWESLKKLYREVAKMIHPDLTTDQAERLLRQKIMTEVNQAYENGNEMRLREIIQEWQNKSESVQEQSLATELIRVIREIAQISDRLKAIEQKIKELKLSELYQIRIKALNIKQEGRDLLAEMASQIDEQIAQAKINLENMKFKVYK